MSKRNLLSEAERVLRVDGMFSAADDAGMLKIEAKKFLRPLVEKTSIMGKCATVYPGAKEYQWSKISRPTDSNMWMAGAGSEGTTNTTFRKPVTSTVSTNAKYFKLPVAIGYEAMMQCIEEENFLTTVKEVIYDNGIVDMEKILLQGDASGGSDPYNQFDGILKAAAAANTTSFSANFDPITHFNVLIDLIDFTVLDRYREEFKFFVHPDIYELYLDYRIAKHLTNAAYKELDTGNENLRYKGFELIRNSQLTSSSTVSPIVFGYARNWKLHIFNDIKIDNPQNWFVTDMDMYRFYMRVWWCFKELYDTHFAVGTDLNHVKGWS